MSRYIPNNTTADYIMKVQKAKIILGFSPTADVVEVVRCKDCRFWEEYCVKDADEIALLEKEFGFEIRITSVCIGECQCKQWQGIGACGIRQTGLNDYCSYGERSEKNEGKVNSYPIKETKGKTK